MKRVLLYSGVGIAVVLILAVTVWYLRGVNIPVLEPAGPIALAERHVIIITLLLCAIVVVPVFILLFLFAWKYRADNPQRQSEHRPDWDHENLLVEFIWWLIPTAIIIALSIVMWQSTHALDPYKTIAGSSPLTVEVVALDWKWLFIYPAENIATVNLLEIPTNVPVTFELTADAPMNSFWIPQLGGQIMAMPGMVTKLNLEASRGGTYSGYSANISGEGFAGMTFQTKAVSQSEFDTWVQSVRDSSASVLTSSTYATLLRPSEYNPVSVYASVDADMYGSIVMKYMTPTTRATSTPMMHISNSTTTSTSTATPMQGTMSGMSGMPMTMP